MTNPQADPLTPILHALARELARELAPLIRDAMVSKNDSKEVAPEAEQYLSVAETCKRFGISRATFDRMFRDPSTGLADVIVRLPPVTGRVRVPLNTFEAWLRVRRQRRRRRRGGDA